MKTKNEETDLAVFSVYPWVFKTRFEYTTIEPQNYALQPIENINHIAPNSMF